MTTPLRVSDKCRCGSVFECEGYKADVKDRHEDWLDRHTVCREVPDTTTEQTKGAE